MVIRQYFYRAASMSPPAKFAAPPGTHYTPRSLTEPIVQHTLEPLVYTGPAEGLPKEQWTLKSPAELLDLKICDMAMGLPVFWCRWCITSPNGWSKPGRKSARILQPANYT